jgi:hypothetical protein
MRSSREPQKRRSKRRSVRYIANLDLIDEAPLQRCVMLDVSETGARLLLPEQAALPDVFVLVLSENRRVVRTCSVVWRSDDQVGVAFKDGESDDIMAAANSSLSLARP